MNVITLRFLGMTQLKFLNVWGVFAVLAPAMLEGRHVLFLDLNALILK